MKRNSHRLGLVILASLLSTACQTPQRSSQPDYSKRLKVLSKRVKDQEKTIQALRAKNYVLSQHTQKSMNPIAVKKRTYAETDKVLKITSEKKLFAHAIKKFRERELVGLNVTVDQFLKNYPLSPHADNVLYLSGRLKMQMGKLGEAIKDFDRLSRSYPQGNKSVSAQLAKAIAYKRLNIKGQAERYFKKVIKDFPGSSESVRAKSELRSLKEKITTS